MTLVVSVFCGCTEIDDDENNNISEETRQYIMKYVVVTMDKTHFSVSNIESDPTTIRVSNYGDRAIPWSVLGLTVTPQNYDETPNYFKVYFTYDGIVSSIYYNKESRTYQPGFDKKIIFARSEINITMEVEPDEADYGYEAYLLSWLGAAQSFSIEYRKMPKCNVTYNWSDIFDCRQIVKGDGSVSNRGQVRQNLTIINNENKSVDLKLSLVHDGKQGIHDNLEYDNFKIMQVKKDNYGVEYYRCLFDWTEEECNGYGQPIYFNLEPFERTNFTIAIIIEDSYPGTSQDGQWYNCKFFLYQTVNDHIDDIYFTVGT